MLLPDLTPWANQAKGFIYDWTVQGNDLRLTSAIANIGAGALELRGGEVHGSSQDVYQRVYSADGSFTDTLAGSFIYHPEHGHIHFEQFAEYRLCEVTADGGVGSVIATGEKVSFCLLDVERYNTSGPASPVFMTCGQIQGISAGWADVYHRGLPGQSIDITNVPNGNYWLEVMVDPTNRIMESDETNNVTRILIDLVRPTGENPIALDTFETNDSFAAAAILAPPEHHVYDNLSIHASQNDDYFRITSSATGELHVELAFQNALGDLDLEVYDAAQTLIGSSDSVSDSESVTINALAGAYYFVKVFGYNGATNPYYSLTIEPPGHHDEEVFTEQADTVVLSTPDGTWRALGGDDAVTGTVSRDIIYGDAGLDTLSGGGGNDDLYGGDGNDILDGGAGADLLAGGRGNDTYITDGIDTITETSNGGTDTVRSVATFTLGANLENLTLLGSDSINGTGNTRVNTITGNSGDNILNGGGGKDKFFGGLGNDTYVTDGGDTITEAFGAGVDTVLSSVTFALGANLDNLTLTGSSKVNATGNALNNVIIGNAAANIIAGGVGADVMTGGGGADRFKFSSISDTGLTPATRDIITDFKVSGADRIELSSIDASSLLSGNNKFIWLGLSAFTTSTAGELRYELFDDVGTDNDYTLVYGDINNDTAAEFTIQLAGLKTLSSSDFYL